MEGSRYGVTKSRTRIKGGVEGRPTPEKEVTGLPLPPRIYFNYVFIILGEKMAQKLIMMNILNSRILNRLIRRVAKLLYQSRLQVRTIEVS